MDAETTNRIEQLLSAFKDDIKSLITQRFDEAKSMSPQHDVIYHYTDVKGALGILQSGRLWLTERSHLNDPLEVVHGLNISREMFRNMVREYAFDMPDKLVTFQDSERYFLADYYGFWTASFSHDGDELTQWRSYADDGRGVSIGFSAAQLNIDKIRESMQGKGTLLAHYDIIYNEQKLHFDIERYITQLLCVLLKANLHADNSYNEELGSARLFERDFITAYLHGVLATSVLYKHPSYCSEREYRLLVMSPHRAFSVSDVYKLRERGGEIVNYLDLPIPGWRDERVIKKIIIGPAAPDQLSRQIHSTIASLGLPDPVIERSQLPYRSMSAR